MQPRTLRVPQTTATLKATQSVTGCMPTRSVGTIKSLLATEPRSPQEAFSPVLLVPGFEHVFRAHPLVELFIGEVAQIQRRLA